MFSYSEFKSDFHTSVKTHREQRSRLKKAFLDSETVFQFHVDHVIVIILAKTSFGAGENIGTGLHVKSVCQEGHGGLKFVIAGLPGIRYRMKTEQIALTEQAETWNQFVSFGFLITVPLTGLQKGDQPADVPGHL